MRTCFVLAAACGTLSGPALAPGNVYLRDFRATVWASDEGLAGQGPVLTDVNNSLYMDRWHWIDPPWSYAEAIASFTSSGSPTIDPTDPDPPSGNLPLFGNLHGGAYTIANYPVITVATAQVDIWFDSPTFRNGGAFEIACTGANSQIWISGVQGYDTFLATVSGGGRLTGYLPSAMRFHLFAYCEGNGGDFSFTIPSPGPLALASLAVGLLSVPRRRRKH